MKKNFKSHGIAVLIAWVLSYGLYLTITAPWSINVSADILGIQQWDVLSSDVHIEQFDEHVKFTANRISDEMDSLHILVMYDDEYVDMSALSVLSKYTTTQNFEKNQWVIVIDMREWIQPNEELFRLYWIMKSDDLIIADIQATFEDWTSERLLFSQPV